MFVIVFCIHLHNMILRKKTNKKGNIVLVFVSVASVEVKWILLILNTF